ncbi:MAG: hypothetical protein PWQ97_105 [Tepidanaerobacteraceae bacterium]|nr:hypothetical protein [Tepidanaerobacteraceae bacterium]
MEVINFARANCKNCYKCIRACPVKAIRMKNNQAEIVEERCITCGTCLTVCPQNAKTVKSDVEKVRKLLEENKDIAVSLAPSFAGAFCFQNYGQMVSALKKLGFSAVYQTSIGARLIAKDYADYYNDKNKSNLITTACPAVNYLIQKYYPELVDCMIPIVSPMIAHGRYLKKIKGYSKVVFIGPCLAKKMEIYDDDKNDIDAVLTFEEVKKFFLDQGIDPVTEASSDGGFSDEANYYPIPGGTFLTIKPMLKQLWRRFISVDGIEGCLKLLEELKKGRLENTWIEMNACYGSCSNGPATGSTPYGPFERLEKIKDFAKHSINNSYKTTSFNIDECRSLDLSKCFSPIKVTIKYPSESEIKNILLKIGKTAPEDELNCGACGYNSCREKAIAVYNGMAEIHMCMPYMRNRAESLSNLIIESTPNAIIVVDRDMKIHEMNPSAESMFQIPSGSFKYKPLNSLFDDYYFRLVSTTLENITNKKVVIKNYGLITLQNIYYLKDHNLIIGIISDITAQERERQKNAKVRQKTLETTQEVIEKQMRVAQEIASLLGETTAETKVMLNKVKQLLIDEMPGEKNGYED